MPAASPILNQKQKNRIIDLAMVLAASHGWAGLTTRRLAKKTGFSIRAVRTAFPSRQALLTAFTRRIDHDMVDSVALEDDQSPHDRLFDLILCRLEALADYRAGIARLLREGGTTPTGLLDILPAWQGSVRLMADLAFTPPRDLAQQQKIENKNGIHPSSKPANPCQLVLLAFIYADTVRVWLKDDSADGAKTMRHLDERLRRLRLA
ncbi:MAG: TetR/AcrR family transcriptional regulator [Pseudomonadota bacterium]